MRHSYLPRSMLRVWELSSPRLGQSLVPDGAVPVLNTQSSESSQEQPNGDHYYSSNNADRPLGIQSVRDSDRTQRHNGAGGNKEGDCCSELPPACRSG